jgi:uncharacterized membrane protein YkvA (DUF1232 family)
MVKLAQTHHMQKLHQLKAFFRDSTVAKWKKALGLVGLVYLLSPLDFLPDAVPLIGWLDDIGVLSAIAAYTLRQVSHHAALKEKEVNTAVSARQ